MSIAMQIGLAILGSGLLFFFIGLACLGAGRRAMRRGRASRSWPTVRGTVRASNVQTSYHDRTRYDQASVLYEYIVGGTTYSSDTVSFAFAQPGNLHVARQTVGRYPVGAEVTVYYDPEDPETAVLEPGATASSAIMLGLGIAFAIGGGLQAVFGAAWVAVMLWLRT